MHFAHERLASSLGIHLHLYRFVIRSLSGHPHSSSWFSYVYLYIHDTAGAIIMAFCFRVAWEVHSWVFVMVMAISMAPSHA